jgi:hypothetical protein
LTVDVSSQRALPAALQTPVKTWRPLWWAYPAWVVLALSCFAGYALFAILDNRSDGSFPPYLSPFYSPHIVIHGIPISPAFWVAWVPLGFRLSCYYYRKAYYRSFAWQPPSCAVTDRPGGYQGETRFPFVFNNFHRYFLYVTVVVLGFLWYDALSAFDFGGHFGIGVGSVIMLINVCLLSGYTLGCHALRNLVGGGLNCFSCSAAAKCRREGWRFVTLLNGRHATWAWFSMFSVAIADIYIRLLIHGALADPRWIS